MVPALSVRCQFGRAHLSHEQHPYTGVIDQYVQPRLLLREIGRGGPDGLQILKIELQEANVQLPSFSCTLHFINCLVDAVFGSAGDIDSRSIDCEVVCGLPADSTIAYQSTC